MPRVLFICTGNFYRSRLAEILFNRASKIQEADWVAKSRGLIMQNRMRGISPSVITYLRRLGLDEYIEKPRDPVPLSVDELTSFELVVLLNAREHLPMLNNRYGWVAAKLREEQKLRLWHIYDVPPKTLTLSNRLGLEKIPPSQPEESGLEHVTFAVHCLFQELTGKPAPAFPSQKDELEVAVSPIPRSNSSSSGRS